MVPTTDTIEHVETIEKEIGHVLPALKYQTKFWYLKRKFCNILLKMHLNSIFISVIFLHNFNDLSCYFFKIVISIKKKIEKIKKKIHIKKKKKNTTKKKKKKKKKKS